MSHALDIQKQINQLCIRDGKLWEVVVQYVKDVKENILIIDRK